MKATREDSPCDCKKVQMVTDDLTSLKWLKTRWTSSQPVKRSNRVSNETAVTTSQINDISQNTKTNIIFR